MATTFSIPFMFANLNLHTASIRYFSCITVFVVSGCASLVCLRHIEKLPKEKKKREDRLASQKANEAIMQFVGDFVASHHELGRS
ncbi:hypothetical protein ZIOFF_029309 [Zingiber officinale]|uniref:Uncharacterized protein n=1 Tax=Zingiber officinale TaxID=94328 RepID=A0A8J5GRD7_ZINOF|nr:hypothetical protein ZIOFF_029309 [Zingiber officinale]